METQILEINNYDPDNLNKIYNIYKINQIENTINIINSFKKDIKSYIVCYNIKKDIDNLSIINSISDEYKRIWFIFNWYDINWNTLKIILSIPGEDINEIKNTFYKYIYNLILENSLNIDMEKLKNIILYKIFEINDFEWSSLNDIYLSNNHFKWLWIEYNNLYETLDNINDDYYIKNKYWIEILVLGLLFTEWTIISNLYLKDKTSQKFWKDKYDYIIHINSSFRKKNLIDLWYLNKELSLFNNTVSIKIIKDNDFFLLEKEHIYYWENTKYVDLVKRYPQSKIVSSVYFGKTNKYTVIEKAKINNIDL
jgi:hypothetical protein